MKWLYALCYIYAAAVLIQARINWLIQKQIEKTQGECGIYRETLRWIADVTPSNLIAERCISALNLKGKP